MSSDQDKGANGGTPMSYSEALEIVHGLALSNSGGRQDALDTLEDLIVNLHEEIDSVHPVADDQQAAPSDRLADLAGPSEDMDLARPSHSIRACIEAAASSPAMPRTEREIQAIDLARRYLVLHGEDLDNRVTAVPVP